MDSVLLSVDDCTELSHEEEDLDFFYSAESNWLYFMCFDGSVAHRVKEETVQFSG